MKNSKIGDAVASEMESILAKDDFKAIFSPVKVSEALSEGFTSEGKYKPFVRIASVKTASDQAQAFKSIVESVSEISKSLEDLGLEKSATVALGLLNGILKEAEIELAPIDDLNEFDESPESLEKLQEIIDQFEAAQAQNPGLTIDEFMAGYEAADHVDESVAEQFGFADDGCESGKGAQTGPFMPKGETMEGKLASKKPSKKIKKAQMMGKPVPEQSVSDTGGKRNPPQQTPPMAVKPNKGFGGVTDGKVSFLIKTENDQFARKMNADELAFYKAFLKKLGLLTETNGVVTYKNLTEPLPVPKTWKSLGYMVSLDPNSPLTASASNKETVALYNKVNEWVKGK